MPKPKMKVISAQVPESTYQMLVKIAKWYRTNGNVSHALRMLIEDAAKGIEGGDMLSRVVGRQERRPLEGVSVK